MALLSSSPEERPPCSSTRSEDVGEILEVGYIVMNTGMLLEIESLDEHGVMVVIPTTEYFSVDPDSAPERLKTISNISFNVCIYFELRKWQFWMLATGPEPR